MAAALAASRGLFLASVPWTATAKGSSSGGLRCLPPLPARVSRSPCLKRSAVKQCHAALQEGTEQSRECSSRAPNAVERVVSEAEAAPSGFSGLPAGLTISSAVCLLELFATDVAEAKHAPQVDAGAFFTNLTTDGLIVWTLTVGALAGFYFLVAPPILLTYFLKRWKKKQLAETMFMFAMVFIFFPGLMIWAPFINTRPFARSTGRYTAETDKAAFRGDEWR
eukprot:TRINITY_DN3473_c0_g3_i10.p1 TRINITY_DN3473_c0_g3~~TRINITY_DN3473_c0_g3_i10.p1  ORF type:complete len:223 (-),score=28.25 TRINITY_DN3473_c0_g3_i10:185-853(-)